MAQKQKAPTPPDIKALRHRIDHWRHTRKKITPMPEELWTEAVSLARRYGLGPVARGLRVDYGTLKIRYDLSSGAADQDSEPRSPGSSGFVEIDWPPVQRSTDAPVTVELSAPDGAKLTVLLSGPAASTVMDLAEAFWRRGA
jgi:hypothetical protein